MTLRIHIIKRLFIILTYIVHRISNLLELLLNCYFNNIKSFFSNKFLN